ncbi:MAG TPA: sugar ABC transporter permease [Longilinea sp.]|nr:sugar ABC transporter permease [Longilinea sp.]
MAESTIEKKSGRKEKAPRSRLEKRNTLLGMLFISPWIIGFIAFTLYPMVMSLFYSFTEYHARRASEWVGLQNYIAMFHDDLYWTSLGNTLYMVVISVPVLLFFSFVCAVLLNLKIKGQSLYRVIYFLPSIVPTVASTLLWLWMLNPQTGMVNSALSVFGIDGPNWFQDPYWSKPALILLGLWGVGGTIIIYLSGLQDVPTALLEAAELDGANWFQRLRHITMPMVSPITLFNLITGVIAMFQYFSQAYVFGAAASTSENALGAPLSSTLFYSVYLYQRGISYLDIGVASAMAWVLFFIILGCTFLLLKVSDKFTYYAG